MVFGFLKNVGGAAAKAAFSEAKAGYKENEDFLEAVCAVSALVAAADGEIDDSEKKVALDVISTHKDLCDIYKPDKVRTTLDTMLKRAGSTSGKLTLYRELDDIKDKPGTHKMMQDVFAVALDIANADGDVGEKEKVALTKIAARIGVDPADFDL